MSKDRLRDHFSAYFDGTLDPALRQSLASKLASDPEFQKEYAQFSRTMELLGDLANEPIEIPIYLSDRITTKLEEAPSKAPSWLDTISLSWFKAAGFASAAVIVIAASYYAYSASTHTATTAESGMVPSVGPAREKADPDYLKIKIINGEVHAFYRSSSPKTLLITSPNTNEVRRKEEIDSKKEANLTLANDYPSTVSYQVEVTGDNRPTLVFVAGKERTSPEAAKGNGSSSAFIENICNKYGVTVQLTVSNPKANIAWKLDSGSAMDDLKNSLVQNGWNVSQMSDGLIVIQDR